MRKRGGVVVHVAVVVGMLRGRLGVHVDRPRHVTCVDQARRNGM